MSVLRTCEWFVCVCVGGWVVVCVCVRWAEGEDFVTSCLPVR